LPFGFETNCSFTSAELIRLNVRKKAAFLPVSDRYGFLWLPVKAKTTIFRAV